VWCASQPSTETAVVKARMRRFICVVSHLIRAAAVAILLDNKDQTLHCCNVPIAPAHPMNPGLENIGFPFNLINVLTYLARPAFCHLLAAIFWTYPPRDRRTPHFRAGGDPVI